MKSGDAGVKNGILTPGGERKKRIHRIGEIRKKNSDNICEGKIMAILKGNTFGGRVSLVDIHPVNSSADEEGGTTVVGCDQNDASIQKEMQKRETVFKSVGAKKTTRSIRKDLSQDPNQRKCVVTTTSM
ncbi:hypothetical protein Tco_1319804 [Tanacetum coccineum]